MSALRPRRTAELEFSNTKQRTSRIAVRCPSTRERSLDRVSSADRGTSSAYLMSTAKRKRSNSATPLRTPTRPIPFHSAITMTGEKERAPVEDKKWVSAQVNKIMDYLRTIESILGKDFFQKGGLKSMSTKQFILIVNHLIRNIAGTRLSIGANYVDDIMKALSMLGYPYSINKSSLKTPCAPHSYNNIIVLLGWLVSFVYQPEDVEHFEVEKLMKDDSFPDIEFSHTFMSRLKEGFVVWNKNNEKEFEEMKKDLIDSFTAKRTDLPNFEAVEQDISVLCAELDTMMDNKVVIKREDEFLKLDEEVKTKRKILAQQEELCKTYESQHEELKQVAKSKINAIAARQERIDTIEEKIEAQMLSIEDRDDLISQVRYLRQVFDSKQQSIIESQNMGSTNQITWSRLLKKKIDLIAKFNSNIYRIFSEVGEYKDTDVEEFLIDPAIGNDLEDHIMRIIPLLEHIKKDNSEQLKQCVQISSELQNQLKEAILEHDILKTRLDQMVKRGEEIEKQLQDWDVEIFEKHKAALEEENALDSQLKQHQVINQQLRKTLELSSKELDSLSEKNKLLFNEIKVKGSAILDLKEKRVNQMEEDVNDFGKTMDQINLKLKDYLPSG